MAHSVSESTTDSLSNSVAKEFLDHVLRNGDVVKDPILSRFYPVHIFKYCASKIDFNIIFPSVPVCLKEYRCIRFPNQNTARISGFPHFICWQYLLLDLLV